MKIPTLPITDEQLTAAKLNKEKYEKTAPVATAPVATAPVATAPVATAPKRLYDKRQDAFPETMRTRFKKGMTAQLKAFAKDRGFNGLSDMTRTAIVFASNHPDFKKGWKPER
jgi:hypothetical protein